MFKPNKAATCKDTSKLNYPVIASPKIDGIRCTIQDGVAMSNSLKPLPSELVQMLFGHECLNGLDGELVYGDPCAEDCYNKTSSAVMSKDLPEHMDPALLTFHVFDKFLEGTSYARRIFELESQINTAHVDHAVGQVTWVSQALVQDETQLDSYEAHHTSQGFEGVMVRSPDGFYKQGRSTVREGGLLKIKRFEDAEAIIIGFEEQMHNENEAFTGELGQTKRSSAKAGLTGAGVLGALVVRDVKTGVEFNVGTGFKADERAALWADREKMVGKTITYKHFPVGAIDKPRHPVFKGFRDPLDISE